MIVILIGNVITYGATYATACRVLGREMIAQRKIKCYTIYNNRSQDRVIVELLSFRNVVFVS